MVKARLAGLFHRGLHVDSRTVVDKPLYGWFLVEGTFDNHGILKVESIQDFPPDANPSRWARAEGSPRKRLHDDGFDLALELSFGPISAYVWDRGLITGILEHRGPLYVEGTLYDSRITVRYAGASEVEGTPALGSKALAVSGG